MCIQFFMNKIFFLIILTDLFLIIKAGNMPSICHSWEMTARTPNKIWMQRIYESTCIQMKTEVF